LVLLIILDLLENNEAEQKFEVIVTVRVDFIIDFFRLNGH